MLKIQEIREIIKLIDQSSIEKFSYEAEGTKIVLKKGNSGATLTTPALESTPAVQQITPVANSVQNSSASLPQQQEDQMLSVEKPLELDSSLHQITSPMVGTFYASSSPEAEAFVQTGDKVKQESIVCIVEAMKLFNEIEAEVSGEIVEILVKDGQLVEFGQPLFHVKAN